jgi:hypothetical protein
VVLLAACSAVIPAISWISLSRQLLANAAIAALRYARAA